MTGTGRPPRANSGHCRTVQRSSRPQAEVAAGPAFVRSRRAAAVRLLPSVQPGKSNSHPSRTSAAGTPIVPMSAKSCGEVRRFPGVGRHEDDESWRLRWRSRNTSRDRRFPGVIGRTFDVRSRHGPRPSGRRQGAPNVLFIVLDDTGFGQLGCYGARSIRRIWTRWPRTGCATTTCTPPRCVRRRARASSPGAITIRTACPASPRARRAIPAANGNIPFENGLLSEILLAERLQHLRGRQVASDAGRADHRGGPVRPLAAGTRLRALSTAFSAATRTNTIPSSSATTTRSSRRRRPSRAIT